MDGWSERTSSCLNCVVITSDWQRPQLLHSVLVIILNDINSNIWRLRVQTAPWWLWASAIPLALRLSQRCGCSSGWVWSWSCCRYFVPSLLDSQEQHCKTYNKKRVWIVYSDEVGIKLRLCWTGTGIFKWKGISICPSLLSAAGPMLLNSCVRWTLSCRPCCMSNYIIFSHTEATEWRTGCTIWKASF